MSPPVSPGVPVSFGHNFGHRVAVVRQSVHLAQLAERPTYPGAAFTSEAINTGRQGAPEACTSGIHGLVGGRLIVYRAAGREDRAFTLGKQVKVEALCSNTWRTTSEDIDLSVRQIFAQSPEARGRVERVAQTFQDRLISELRLARARTSGEANRVLFEFHPRFNETLLRPDREGGSSYRSEGSSLV